MSTFVKPTTKNSPKVTVGKNPNNKSAETYAKRGTDYKLPDENDKNYINEMNVSAGGVSKGNYKPIKTDGIKIRGTGAATKALIARGPMA